MSYYVAMTYHWFYLREIIDKQLLPRDIAHVIIGLYNKCCYCKKTSKYM